MYNTIGPTAKVSVSATARAVRTIDEPDRIAGLKNKNLLYIL